ncbi:MAG TPA: hypothetical protein VFP53_07420 [Sphingomicrobium sp.]|nr:hypothetical protein [Sphingomicrobium sp.]
MPYRRAHWWLLALFPLAGLAFWRSYLSQVATAPMEFHAHGVTASLWIVMLAFQSWSIHSGRRELHRTVGPLSLALFPLFLAGGSTIFIGMAQRYAAALSPFYTLYAPRLAWLDIVGVGGIAYFYFEAIRQRRKVHPHSRYLLATVIFLLPPILGRLMGSLPMLAPIDGDFTKLGIGFQIANAITALIAFGLAVQSGKHGRPFFLAGILTVIAAMLYQTVGGMTWWKAVYASAAAWPAAPFALVAGLSGVAIGYCAWVAGRRPVAVDGALAA